MRPRPEKKYKEPRTPKRRRVSDIVYLMTILTAFETIGIAMLVFPRSTESITEKRELKKFPELSAESWFSGEFKGEPLPLLAEVADRCRQHGMMANIEIKPTTGTGPLTGKVIALAARELWEGMTVPLLSSFDIDALEAAQAAVPELPRGLLLDEWREDWRALTARLGCVSIHLNHKLLDEARVMLLKEVGLHILVYTVNKPQRAAELLRWGVDSICTDAIDQIGPNFIY